MKQKTWPCKSDSPHFIALPFIKKPHTSSNFIKSSRIHLSYFNSKPNPSSSPSSLYKGPDFSALPYDVLARIMASFSLPDLRAASLVCRAWRDALKLLREAMVFLKWGKRFKHGRGGMKANLSKALDSFLKGAARGSTLAMVDAGLIYWELGKREVGISWYRRAAELGDPAGQCNLALSFLQGHVWLDGSKVDWKEAMHSWKEMDEKLILQTRKRQLNGYTGLPSQAMFGLNTNLHFAYIKVEELNKVSKQRPVGT